MGRRPTPQDLAAVEAALRRRREREAVAPSSAALDPDGRSLVQSRAAAATSQALMRAASERERAALAPPPPREDVLGRGASAPRTATLTGVQRNHLLRPATQDAFVAERAAYQADPAAFDAPRLDALARLQAGYDVLDRDYGGRGEGGVLGDLADAAARGYHSIRADFQDAFDGVPAQAMAPVANLIAPGAAAGMQFVSGGAAGAEASRGRAQFGDIRSDGSVVDYVGDAAIGVAPSALAVAVPEVSVPVAAYFALQGFGSGRRKAKDNEAATGEDVGLAAELATGLGFAAVEFASERLGFKGFERIGTDAAQRIGFRMLRSAPKEVAGAYARAVAAGAAQEGTEEAVSQFGQNIVGMMTNRPDDVGGWIGGALDGVGDAALQGALGGAMLAPLGIAARRRRFTAAQRRAADRSPGDMMVLYAADEGQTHDVDGSELALPDGVARGGSYLSQIWGDATGVDDEGRPAAAGPVSARQMLHGTHDGLVVAQLAYASSTPEDFRTALAAEVESGALDADEGERAQRLYDELRLRMGMGDPLAGSFRLRRAAYDALGLAAPAADNNAPAKANGPTPEVVSSPLPVPDAQDAQAAVGGAASGVGADVEGAAVSVGRLHEMGRAAFGGREGWESARAGVVEAALGTAKSSNDLTDAERQRVAAFLAELGTPASDTGRVLVPTAVDMDAADGLPFDAPVAPSPAPVAPSPAPVASNSPVPEAPLPGEEAMEDAFAAGAYAEGRGRGYVEVAGRRYDRQEPLVEGPGVAFGEATPVTFRKDVTPQARWAVVEADALQPSHRRGRPNPRNFIADAQPRSRSDFKGAGVTDTAIEIATKLRPDEVTHGGTAYAGAPVVNGRGEVIQGNGRADGLALYHETNPTDPSGYRAALAAFASLYGFDAAKVAAMQKPVLVRVADVADNEAVRLGGFQSSDTEATSDAATNAKALVQRMDEGAARRFLSVLAARSEAMPPESTLAAVVIASRTALVAQLVADGVVLPDKTDAMTTDALRSLVKALFFKGQAPEMLDVYEAFVPGAFRLGFERGLASLVALPTDARLHGTLGETARLARRYAEQGGGMPVDDFLVQDDMFEGALVGTASPEAVALFRMAFGTADAAAASQRETSEAVRRYASLARGRDADPSSMFPDAVPGVPKEQAFAEAFGAYDPRQSPRLAPFVQATPAATSTATPATPTPAAPASAPLTRPTNEAQTKPAPPENPSPNRISPGGDGRTVGDGQPGAAPSLDEVLARPDATGDDVWAALTRKYGGRLLVGIDPEMMVDGFKAVRFFVQIGVVRFADLSRDALAKAGDWIKPYLKPVYNYTRDMLAQGTDEDRALAAQMDGYDAVQAYGLDAQGENAPAETDRVDDASAEATPDTERPVTDTVPPVRSQWKTADLTYRHKEDGFTVFYPETAEGRQAWDRIVEVMGGAGEVPTAQASDTMTQLRRAGYVVHKAEDKRVNPDEIAAELNDLDTTSTLSTDDTPSDGLVDDARAGAEPDGVGPRDAATPGRRGAGDGDRPGGEGPRGDGTDGQDGRGVPATLPARQGARGDSGGDGVGAAARGGDAERGDTRRRGDARADGAPDAEGGRPASRGDAAVSRPADERGGDEGRSALAQVRDDQGDPSGGSAADAGARDAAAGRFDADARGDASAAAASVGVGVTPGEPRVAVQPSASLRAPLPAADAATETAREVALLGMDAATREGVQQAADAEGVAVRLGDATTIRATLPLLFYDQHEDVRKAEARFAGADAGATGGPDGGRGILFTNAAGTGKTLTGLGIAKRFALAGKTRLLVVVPSDTKARDWAKEAVPLGLALTPLAGVSDGGTAALSAGGGVVTTYANFYQNEALSDGDGFDLILFDEAHKLSSSKDGDVTQALGRFRRLAGHPYYGTYSAAQVREAASPEDRAVLNDPAASLAEKTRARTDTEWEMRQRGAPKAGADTKVVFLSATPFAYHRSILYGEGFLFPAFARGGFAGYNQPSAEQAFFVDTFGYRMRTGKLTSPEAGVDSDVMERAFTERQRTAGALSGRAMASPYDYSRDFVLVGSGVGQKIQEGFDVLRAFGDDAPFPLLGAVFAKRTRGLAMMQLLETLKAQASLGRIREHADAGRKVVVFHAYNNATAEHPFRFAAHLAAADLGIDRNDPKYGRLEDEIERFEREHADLVALDLAALVSVPRAVQDAFGADAVLFNGTVAKGQRTANLAAFQSDAPGSPRVLVVQSDAGKEGLNANDQTGEHPRVVVTLSLPVKPTDAAQIEGRVYRLSNRSNAIFEYPVLGLDFERRMFAEKVASRAGTAENLALGDEARMLRQRFVDGFLAADVVPVVDARAADQVQGTGGKDADRAREGMRATPYDEAVSAYFAQQKRTGRTKSAEGEDYYATPEPLGFKMVEWAGVPKGSRVLEPSAGHGAVARYAAHDYALAAVEPSSALASRLMLAVGAGSVHQGTFEDYSVHRKADAVVMNPPFGVGGKAAFAHVEKAMQHLSNGGRIVAVVPRGGRADQRLAVMLSGEAFGEKGAFRLAAQVELPAGLFARAGTGVATRLVVIDRSERPAAAHAAWRQAYAAAVEAAPERPAVRIDLSEGDGIENGRVDFGAFFERLRDVALPPRRTPLRREAEHPDDVREAEAWVEAQALRQEGGGALSAAAPAPAAAPGAKKGKTRTAPVSAATHPTLGKAGFSVKPSWYLGDDYPAARTAAMQQGGQYVRGVGFWFPDKAGAEAFAAALLNPPAPERSYGPPPLGDADGDAPVFQRQDTPGDASPYRNEFFRDPAFQKAYDAVEVTRDAEGRLLAPNGQVSNLTEDQYRTVRTPQFKAWFGDWENDPANASKVVHPETGEPLVVYHAGAFNENEHGVPDLGKQGMHFGTRAAAQERSAAKHVDDFIAEATIARDENEDGDMAWFWDSQGVSSFDYDPLGFATEAEARAHLERTAMSQEAPEDPYYDGDDQGDFGGMVLTEAFLNIQSPAVEQDQGADWSEAVAGAKEKNHDGLRYRNLYEDKGSASFVAFAPAQIKSATGNRGTFDGTRDDIREQRQRRQMPGFGPAGATAVRASVDEIADALAPVVQAWQKQGGDVPRAEVVESLADLPADLRTAMGEGVGQVRGEAVETSGIYWRGSVYLVASGIRGATKQDVQAKALAALVHEAVGHHGLRGVLGKAITPVLREVYVRFKDHAAMKNIRRLYADQSEVRQAEELLAYFAETGADEGRGVVEKAVAAVRAWLREKGVKLALSEADLRHIVAAARARTTGTTARTTGATFSRSEALQTPDTPDAGIAAQVERAAAKAVPASGEALRQGSAFSPEHAMAAAQAFSPALSQKERADVVQAAREAGVEGATEEAHGLSLAARQFFASALHVFATTGKAVSERLRPLLVRALRFARALAVSVVVASAPVVVPAGHAYLTTNQSVPFAEFVRAYAEDQGVKAVGRYGPDVVRALRDVPGVGTAIRRAAYAAGSKAGATLGGIMEGGLSDAVVAAVGPEQRFRNQNEDLLAEYLGLSHELPESLHRPSSATLHEGMRVLSVGGQVRLRFLTPETMEAVRARLSQMRVGDVLSEAQIDSLPWSVQRANTGSSASMGRFTFSLGRDERGYYFSTYDIWDFAPQGYELYTDRAAAPDVFEQPTNTPRRDYDWQRALMEAAGEPFVLYDRFYFTPDGLEATSRQTGMPPVLTSDSRFVRDSSEDAAADEADAAPDEAGDAPSDTATRRTLSGVTALWTAYEAAGQDATPDEAAYQRRRIVRRAGRDFFFDGDAADGEGSGGTDALSEHPADVRTRVMTSLPGTGLRALALGAYHRVVAHADDLRRKAARAEAQGQARDAMVLRGLAYRMEHQIARSIHHAPDQTRWATELPPMDTEVAREKAARLAPVAEALGVLRNSFVGKSTPTPDFRVEAAIGSAGPTATGRFLHVLERTQLPSGKTEWRVVRSVYSKAGAQLVAQRLQLERDVAGALRGDAAAAARLTPDQAAATASLRREQDAFFDYLVDAGAVEQDAKIKGYLRRVYDRDTLVAHHKAFVDVVARHLLPVLRKANPDANVTDADAAAVAEDIRTRIVYGDFSAMDDELGGAGGTGSRRTADLAASLGRPGSLKTRGLAFIPDAELQPFLVTDLPRLLTQSVTEGVTYAEYVRRFGREGQAPRKLVADLVKAGEADAAAVVVKTLKAQRGLLGLTSAQSTTLGRSARRASHVVRALTAMSVLTLTGIKSLGEFGAIPLRFGIVRGGRGIAVETLPALGAAGVALVHDVLAAATRGTLAAQSERTQQGAHAMMGYLKGLERAGQQGRKTRLLERLGAVSEEAVTTLLQERYFGTDAPLARAQALVFRANFIETVTRVQRRVAAAAALTLVEDILSHEGPLPRSLRADARRLNLPIDAAERATLWSWWEQSSRDTEGRIAEDAGVVDEQEAGVLRRIASAVTTATGQTIVMGNASTRPLLASSHNPLAQMAMQLTDFSYAFKAGPLAFALDEAADAWKEDDYGALFSLLMRLLGLVVTTALAGTAARAVAYDEGDEGDRKILEKYAAEPTLPFFLKSVNDANLFGPLVARAAMYETSVNDFHRNPAVAAMGPTADRLTEMAAAVTKPVGGALAWSSYWLASLTSEQKKPKPKPVNLEAAGRIAVRTLPLVGGLRGVRKALSARTDALLPGPQDRARPQDGR